jgi:hypothetical protein
LKTLFILPFLLPMTVAACLMSGTAAAQTTISYASPIADYQPYVDEKIVSWKAANDQVGQIGGWRAYAKEAQRPESSPDNLPTPIQKLPASPSSSDAMKTDPHAGHKK